MSAIETQRPHGRGLFVFATILSILGLIGAFTSNNEFGRVVGWIILVTALLAGIKGFNLRKSSRQSNTGLDSHSHASSGRAPPENSPANSSGPVNTQPPDDAPTEKQIRYAHILGIAVTPNMGKWELSDLITQAERDNPKRQRQRQHAIRGGRVKRFGEALVAEEELWAKLFETTNFVLAVYREGADIVVDVLRVNDAAIGNDKQLWLAVAAPKTTKDRNLGKTLEWERNFQLKRANLLHYEPLSNDIRFCELDGGIKEYREIVEHGMAIAKKLSAATTAESEL